MYYLYEVVRLYVYDDSVYRYTYGIDHWGITDGLDFVFYFFLIFSSLWFLVVFFVMVTVAVILFLYNLRKKRIRRYEHYQRVKNEVMKAPA